MKRLARGFVGVRNRSPSPRKAWIETVNGFPHIQILTKSPSPRKAWIETKLERGMGDADARVAFPPEGVD